MLKKLFRWLAVIFLLLIILLTALVVGVNHYLESNREKLLQDLVATAGLNVAFREMDISIWRQFPNVSIAMDSLVVQDTSQAAVLPALLVAEHVAARLSVANLLRRQIDVQSFTLTDAAFHLESDSLGTFNVGSLLQGSGGQGPSVFRLHWDGMQVNLQKVGLYYDHPIQYKRMGTFVDSLRAQLTQPAADSISISADVDTQVQGIAFNTRKGAYLENTGLRGKVQIDFGPEEVRLSPTRLAIGQQHFEVMATLSLEKGDTSFIELTNEATDYELTRMLMHDSLRAKLAKHYVDAPFPVKARVVTTLAAGTDPEVTINFVLTGQQVKIQQYTFREVHTKGTLVNRLSVAEGGIPGSKKNLRIALDSVHGFREDVFIEAPYALVGIANNNPHLEAPLRLTGPAPAVSRWLQNRDFFFEQGSFALRTFVNAPLNEFEKIVTETNAQLWLQQTNVVYRPAEVSFPFHEIYLAKSDQDVNFRLQSQALPTGFTFDLAGTIDNLVPLIVDKPGEDLSTAVRLEAPRIDWTDFLAFFGQGGYLKNDNPAASTVVDSALVKRLKVALTGLESRFHPTIDARFDTVAYYDLFTLTDFSTGLHFDESKLILEETSFNWAGSNIAFGAGISLHQDRETPFQINAQTEHLNLNALRPTLNYFGLQLPVELDSLPDDLKIDFTHQGRLQDAGGIVPGHNLGNLVFDDGKNELFSGNMNYGPGAEGLHTHLLLRGDPHIVNVLFGAENFFFGTGQFDLDLALTGIPKNLPELLSGSTLQLNINDSKVAYQPAEVFVPVRHFSVDVADGRAAYALHLVTDSTQRSVKFNGELDRLAAFLAPDRTESFRVKTTATAAVLGWSDLQNFFQPVERKDTITSSNTTWLSATEGVFNSFRPELHLQIDTFWLWDQTPVIDLHSGLHLRDSTQLILEESGFSLGEGSVKFQATYALDEELQSPFALSWEVDNLSLDEVRQQFRQSPPDTLPQQGTLTGKLSTTGTMTGLLDEQEQRIVFDSTQGDFDYSLTNLQLSNWEFLRAIGKKALMRKRFERVIFQPLHGQLSLTNNVLTIPRTEVQSTALQLFIEGTYHLNQGPDLLVTLPLRNIGRGVLQEPPLPTGYAAAGWKVFLAMPVAEEAAEKTKVKFRLGRRKYHREHGTLEEWRREKEIWRAQKQERKRSSKKNQ